MNCKLKFLNLLKSEVIATRDDIDLDTDREALGTLKNELDLVTHQTLSWRPRGSKILTSQDHVNCFVIEYAFRYLW